MFISRNKNDLIIEVWEKLDCESVGKDEIQAIETAVLGEFGRSAVDSPTSIARLLADEGAELRHSEILDLYVAKCSAGPYDAALLNLLKLDDLGSALASLARTENLRLKFVSEGDVEGERLLRQLVLHAKLKLTNEPIQNEIAEWLTIWLGSPAVFESWVRLRMSAKGFTETFGPELKLGS